MVARDGEFVFAQVIADVVTFLGLEEDTAPALTPAELVSKYRQIIAAAVQYMHLMPDDALTRELPNRPRSWRVLMHHVFQIPNAFLLARESGETFTYENLLAGPPDAMQTSQDIAAFGESVVVAFDRWWSKAATSDFNMTVDTYFGDTTLHELLERTVWHSTQHVRQIASLLEQIDIEATPRLSASLLAGLPLTDKVWDEN
ncbi:MAG: DinB family protein [Pseudomonadota bacterium]